jgi:hypothetical protein
MSFLVLCFFTVMPLQFPVDQTETSAADITGSQINKVNVCLAVSAIRCSRIKFMILKGTPISRCERGTEMADQKIFIQRASDNRIINTNGNEMEIKLGKQDDSAISVRKARWPGQKLVCGRMK